MTNIRRYISHNKPIFITAVCHKRVPHLKAETAKQMLLDIVHQVQMEKPFSLYAYVMLDDHIHWLLHIEDETRHTMSDIMQSIKLRFTHRLKRSIGATENISIWQSRFWDHIIRDDSDMIRHLDYIHFNPVKHGYVKQPIHYPFSSFEDFVTRGKYNSDWGSGTQPESIDGMNFE